MQAENTALAGYLPAIAEVTGAPESALPILEEIMRDEVFHCTLDWQSASEFLQGARKAYAIYLGDREFYEANARWRKAVFRASVAEQALEGCRGDELVEAQAKLEAAKCGEAAAKVHLDQVSIC